MHMPCFLTAVQTKLAVEVAVQVDEIRSKETLIFTADGEQF